MYIYVVERLAMTNDGYVSARIECAYHTYDEAQAHVMEMERLDKEAVAEDGDDGFVYVYKVDKIWLN